VIETMTKPATESGAVAIVLAAGKGTRMDSDGPKVLCQALGRPLVDYVLDAVRDAAIGRVLVVVGYQADRVRQALADRPGLEFVEQTEQLGTGHAVMVCRDQLRDHDGPVLVLTGDSPLFQPRSIQQLLLVYERDRPACVMGSLHKANPTGLGRIVRDEQGDFVGIVEEKDASEEQRQITEVNMSLYVFDCRELLHALDYVRNDNRQREYYLTDCPGVLKSEGKDVRALPVLQPCEALSVNTVAELRLVEQEMQRLGY
jgi:bifunctional UDP-N-acetylglucosamine pyrophosphorylase/glucosamine-1-phosphate N-acetyltransferase/UDP-N-acetylglucosamine pyrophosphorylase